MVYVFSVVGASNSGKTWLIEQIIPELIKRGFRVGSLKHTPKGFSIDYEKDSGRHYLAGSEITFFGNDSSSAMISKIPLSKDSLNKVFFIFDIFDVDIVVGEGFKHLRIPKIVTIRGEHSVNSKEISGPILCFVSDSNKETIQGKPVFRFNQVDKIVDKVLEHYNNVYLKQVKDYYTHLIVNEVEIPLNPYVKTILGSVITAIIKTLKGVPEPQSVSIYFKKQRKEEK